VLFDKCRIASEPGLRIIFPVNCSGARYSGRQNFRRFGLSVVQQWLVQLSVVYFDDICAF
jgi:hypothetical protein